MKVESLCLALLVALSFSPQFTHCLGANYLFNETNGWNGAVGEVIDASPYSNHGQAYSGATTATDDYGTHGVFTGACYVYIPNPTNVDFAANLTLSFWLNVTNTSANGWILHKNYGSGEFGIYLHPGTLKVVFYQGNHSYQIVPPQKIIPNKWHHIAVTRSHTNWSLYSHLNGVLQHSYEYGPASSSNPILIGAGLKGSMDEVAIDNSKWASGVVSNIYDADRDLLPKIWEEAQGLDPNNAADAAADQDSDGFSTYHEYVEGTDPFESNSVPGDLRAQYDFDEAGGWSGYLNDVIDSSGKSNNGKAYNGATTSVESNGTYGLFSGTGYVEVANSTNLQIATDLTLSFWIKSTNVMSGGWILHKNYSSGEFGLFLHAGTMKLEYGHGSLLGVEKYLAVTSYVIQQDQWYHVAITRSFTNRNIKTYLNGIEQYSYTYSTNLVSQPSDSGNPLQIGYGLRGKMDEVVIDNRVWPSNEVHATYSSGSF